MIIGFTGTSSPIPKVQQDGLNCALTTYYDKYGARKLHHGMCICGDHVCHLLASNIGYYIIGHPGVTRTGLVFKRAPVTATCNEVLAEKYFLDRNHDIVDSSDVLIAAPKTDYEEQRSGTWATVRYALKKHKPVWVVWPTGEHELYTGKT